MMWDVPRYRIRAYVRNMRKTQGGPVRSRKTRRLHLKRTHADIRIIEGFGTPGQIIPARIVLNDITPAGTFLMSGVPFQEGQLVNLTINEPHMFYAKGRVVSCQPLSLQTRVLSETPFPFRVEIRFEFKSVYEKNAVRSYCTDVLNRYLFGTA